MKNNSQLGQYIPLMLCVSIGIATIIYVNHQLLGKLQIVTMQLATVLTLLRELLI